MFLQKNYIILQKFCSTSKKPTNFVKFKNSKNGKMAIYFEVVMFDYKKVFRFGEHYLTIRNRKDDSARRFLLKNKRQIENSLKHQKSNQDIFITKYPMDRNIDMIILDFDSEDKSLALEDAKKLRDFLKTKIINSVIVESTNKGYHLYIQIPYTHFHHIEFTSRENNRFFNEFVKNLINLDELKLETLDKTNFNAGLGGNIRLIGSIHPSTNKKVDIFIGKFINQDDGDYIYNSLKYVNEIYIKSFESISQKMKEEVIELTKIQKERKERGIDKNLIKSNDLREILPTLFGGDYKAYDNGYVYMQCFNHQDSRPSMLVTKEFYSCTACGEKGNIWTLHKKGYINIADYDKE